MIIIWRRWGPVGLVFLILGFLLWVGISQVIRASLHIVETTGWWSVIALVIGFGIGALANWLFAVNVVEPRLDRRNTETPRASSTLFFIPLRHWTWVIGAFGVLFLIPNAIAAATR
jgi:hypothetical protein